jgi:hypothetical protein
MILAVSIAPIRERSVPTWVGIVSLLLGVLSFATVAAVGLFAWLLWLIGAALLMLFGRGADRTRST